MSFSHDDSSYTDCTCFDWDDGDGAFSVNHNNSNQARSRREDDNDSSEDDAIDSMTKSVMSFIFLQEDKDTGRGENQDNVPIKK